MFQINPDRSVGMWLIIKEDFQAKVREKILLFPPLSAMGGIRRNKSVKMSNFKIEPALKNTIVREIFDKNISY